MTDCPNPICHENMKLALEKKPDYEAFNGLKECVRKKVSKRAVLGVLSGLIPLIIILGGIGINVWSQQEAADDKYAQNKDMVKVQVVVEHLAKDIQEMNQDFKKGQIKAQKDREEMLRLLREK